MVSPNAGRTDRFATRSGAGPRPEISYVVAGRRRLTSMTSPVLSQRGHKAASAVAIDGFVDAIEMSET
jgi:hypothetical protein